MSESWSNYKIDNRQGLALDALLINSESPRKTESAPDSGPLVIVCHGFTGSKEGGGRALEMGENLSCLGFNVLLFDFTGCGLSEGSLEDITLTRQIEDLSSVVQWSREQGYEHIILNGRSFGGSTVIGYAARDEKIKAVCTWAAVANLSELFEGFAGQKIEGPSEERVAIVDNEEEFYLHKEFFYDLQKHNILQNAAAIDPRPFLIIHGTDDEVVPVKDAELLYNAAGKPRHLVLLEGADHRFSNHMNWVWDHFFRWLSSL